MSCGISVVQVQSMCIWMGWLWPAALNVLAWSLTLSFISACDCSSMLNALYGQVQLSISSLELRALTHTHTHTHADIHTHSCTQRTPVLGMFIQGWPCAALSDKGAVKSTVDSGSAGEHVSRCLFNNLFTVNTLTASLTPFTPSYLQCPLAECRPLLIAVWFCKKISSIESCSYTPSVKSLESTICFLWL